MDSNDIATVSVGAVFILSMTWLIVWDYWRTRKPKQKRCKDCVAYKDCKSHAIDAGISNWPDIEEVGELTCHTRKWYKLWRSK